jgi:cytosine/adenosine deaminase-related metal-dependent hydrolase
VATIIRDVRPWGGERRDLVLEDGLITAVVAPGARVAAPGDETVEGGGRLALPGFADAHVHLDSTRVGLPFRPHSAEPGPLWNQISNDRKHWREAEKPVGERAAITLGRAIAHGMTRARSYAQVDADCRLERLDGVLAARERYREHAEVQVVAFPQAGILLEPGVPELLDQALRSGADLVGGIDPCALDRDPVRHLDVLFGLAERHGCPVDIHLHEPGELGLWTLTQILDRVAALGLRGRVTVAHLFALGGIAPALASPYVQRLADLDVAVTTIAPGDRGPLPVQMMTEAGVRVGLGQDGQRDYWSPFGSTDMLDRTWQLAFTQGVRQDRLIEHAAAIATAGGASVIDPGLPRLSGLDDRPGLSPGDPAEIALIPGETVTSAVMDRPGGRTTVHRGRVVAHDGALR